MNFLTVKYDRSSEFIEKKSRFIGHAFYTETEEQALACINSIKEMHASATHNVFAYSLRENNTQRFNDDGEPQGTAGMPVLSVIKNNGLVDVCIVVTRYFGGVMLGAGGLVRAYSKAAAAALQESKKTSIDLITSFKLEYNYDMHNNIVKILEERGASVCSQTFLENITIEAAIADDKFLPMVEEIENIYYKNIKITELKKEYTRTV